MTTEGFLRSTIIAGADGCVFWPFGRDKFGYGRASDVGFSSRLAHRIVCEMAHGAPSPESPMAIHSCGNGHLGCVNPKHLRWGTAKENATDKKTHGTQPRGVSVPRSKLDDAAVLKIRGLRANGWTQKSIAESVGVHHTTVQAVIEGRTWRHV